MEARVPQAGRITLPHRQLFLLCEARAGIGPAHSCFADSRVSTSPTRQLYMGKYNKQKVLGQRG